MAAAPADAIARWVAAEVGTYSFALDFVILPFVLHFAILCDPQTLLSKTSREVQEAVFFFQKTLYINFPKKQISPGFHVSTASRCRSIDSHSEEAKGQLDLWNGIRYEYRRVAQGQRRP